MKLVEDKIVVRVIFHYTINNTHEKNTQSDTHFSPRLAAQAKTYLCLRT